MKLLRVGAKGAEKPAILAEDGSIRDLTGIVGDIGGQTLTPEGLARIRGTDIGVLPKLDEGQRTRVDADGGASRIPKPVAMERRPRHEREGTGDEAFVHGARPKAEVRRC